MRQTSSASIFPPLVSRMTGLLPRLLPIPGPLVETGSTLVVVCEVAMRAGEAFGLGEGDGEGDTDCDGDGEGGGGVSSAAATGMIGCCGSVTFVLNPR